MRTHIDCIISKSEDYSQQEVDNILTKSYDRLCYDYKHLEKSGSFTIEPFEVNWDISFIEPENENQKGYLYGENNSLSIEVYEHIIVISCLERFSSLYLPDKRISKQVFQVFKIISQAFGAKEMIIGEGGMGKTDAVLDMVYRSATFSKILEKMLEFHGTPASKLAELCNKSWLFVR